MKKVIEVPDGYRIYLHKFLKGKSAIIDTHLRVLYVSLAVHKLMDDKECRSTVLLDLSIDDQTRPIHTYLRFFGETDCISVSLMNKQYKYLAIEFASAEDDREAINNLIYNHYEN